MFQRTLRWLIPIVALSILSSCSDADSPQHQTDLLLAQGERYTTDPSFRRRALEDSFINPDNSYAQTRLERYTEDQWGSLPIWNPRVLPVRRPNEPKPTSTDFGAATDLDAVPWTREALIALGTEAFFTYPMQISSYLYTGIESEENADRYGLWSDTERGLGGAVWVELPSKSVALAQTCSTCHATTRDGGPAITGLNNSALSIAGMINATSPTANLAWLPGTLDVTPDAVENPTAIPDMRAIQHQQHLHRAGTLSNDLVALAIRIETLIITSHTEAVRPPRKITFALALMLWTLQPEPQSSPDAISARGALHFQTHCASCHQPPAYSGPLVPLDAVGTDPAVALSPARTTGRWRVPSLLGVGLREGLMSSGAIRDLEHLLDPERDVVGHTFGHTLGADERAELVAFLKTL